MPLIIAATDHSAIGDNAVQYAAALAAEWNCSLVLLHAYFIPVTFNDPAMPVIPQDNLMDVATERMDHTLMTLHSQYPQVNASSRVTYGDIHDVLTDVADELQPDLVVVGSHGDDNAEMWMGSTTLDLLRHARYPVLAVPPAAVFRPLKQLCLALDFSGSGERLPVAALNQLQQTSGAAIHLLHVAKEAEQQGIIFEDMPLAGAVQHLKPAFHLAQTDGDVDEKIAQFCEAHNMDWLAVIPHHHSFWESLFHKSHTKKVVRVSHIPVLALHEEQA